MALILIIALAVVLYFYGRSVAVQLSKSFREAGIFALVLLAVLALIALVCLPQFNL